MQASVDFKTGTESFGHKGNLSQFAWDLPGVAQKVLASWKTAQSQTGWDAGSRSHIILASVNTNFLT